MADVGDGGGFLSAEIFDSLEGQPYGFGDIAGHLSLNALQGTQGNKSIHLRALVGNQVLSILLDSGSSHTFVNVAMLDRIPHLPTPSNPMTMKVPNGQKVLSNMEVKGLEWWLQGHTFKWDARVVNLAAYNLILGMDWLEQFSPMTCEWKKKWVEF